MSDIDRIYQYHSHSEKTEQQLFEDEIVEIARSKNPTAQDYIHLANEYRKMREQRDDFRQKYLENNINPLEYKMLSARSQANFRFLFIFAFLAGMIGTLYASPYLNFAEIVWNGALSAVVASFIGSLFKMAYETCHTDFKHKLYVIAYIASIVAVFLMQNVNF